MHTKEVVLGENKSVCSSMHHDKIFHIDEVVPRSPKGYEFFKRAFDVFFAVLGFAICMIPMLVIAIAIKIDSKGPVMYKQDRWGLSKKEFVIYKFRTMHTDAERSGPRWAKENDHRCTRVGRFLRKTRLDELPQLINIIKGEMSFVGPRPERPFFYEKFEEYIHGFENRLVVKPGLTGLAQINGGYTLLPEEKIILDMEYIENRSFWGDIKLIFSTVKLIFTHEGAR